MLLLMTPDGPDRSSGAGGSGGPRLGGATVCLLTPLGQGGLAAVRVFGPGANEIIGRLLAPQSAAGLPTDPARLGLVRVCDPATPGRSPAFPGQSPPGGEQIDQGIVRPLPAGLGAELTLHGGVRIVQRVVAACQALGARRLDLANPAGRDELWRQSWLLAKAERIKHPGLWADIELALPRARTQAAAEWLVAQWSTGLAEQIRSLREEALNGQPVAEALGRLLAEGPGWRRAIAGVRVAIVGPSNSGKSTLLNTLAGTAAAVVSDEPGTTRDYVARWVNLDGLAVEIIDTAGLRAEAGELEARAAILSGPVVRSADLRLILLDRSVRPAGEELAKMEALAGFQPAVWVVNKCDLPAAWDAVAAVPTGVSGGPPLSISALTGDGLAEIGRAIRARLGIPALAPPAPGLLADRQEALIWSAGRAKDSAGLQASLGKVLDG